MYNNTKSRLWQKRVFVTEPGADLVRNMVEHVRVLTEPLALASGIDKLFLANSGKSSQVGYPDGHSSCIHFMAERTNGSERRSS